MATEGRNFRQLLGARMASWKFVCVGLDPDKEKIPRCFSTSDISPFLGHIIDATADTVAAYKPNSAFFERHGRQGLDELEKVMKMIRKRAPDVPVILDFKRGDIGNTNTGYVVAAFDNLGADAVTIHGYLGQEAMQPFLDRADKGVFVLVRTSNPGSDELQMRQVLPTLEEVAGLKLDVGEFIPHYQVVAHAVAKNWNALGNCGVVAGATYPEELAVIRRTIGEDMPILIPGVGAQGGDLEAAVKAGRNSAGQGFVINSSRGIIFADDPAKAARELNDQINLALVA